tara:strand:- start:10371 stop:10538 length:168 start_codon:yes stop_codon:yes gene_type:complete
MQLSNILNSFDHLIEMLQDSGVETEIIGMVESAKEALEEQCLEEEDHHIFDEDEE